MIEWWLVWWITGSGYHLDTSRHQAGWFRKKLLFILIENQQQVEFGEFNFHRLMNIYQLDSKSSINKL